MNHANTSNKKDKDRSSAVVQYLRFDNVLHQCESSVGSIATFIRITHGRSIAATRLVSLVKGPTGMPRQSYGKRDTRWPFWK
jgi:hypothetical protein